MKQIMDIVSMCRGECGIAKENGVQGWGLVQDVNFSGFREWRIKRKLLICNK